MLLLSFTSPFNMPSSIQFADKLAVAAKLNSGKRKASSLNIQQKRPKKLNYSFTEESGKVLDLINQKYPVLNLKKTAHRINRWYEDSTGNLNTVGVRSIILADLYSSRLLSEQHTSKEEFKFDVLKFETAILLAIKMIEDRPISNKNWAKYIVGRNVADLKDWEIQILKKLQFNVNISKEAYQKQLTLLI